MPIKHPVLAMVVPNVRQRCEVQSSMNAEVALMVSPQETPCTMRATCKAMPLGNQMYSAQASAPNSSEAATSGLRPSASDSEPPMNKMVNTPIRYDTMVSEMSASVRPRAILYSAYSGTGTATAAKVSSMAHAAMMALLRSFAFDALRLSIMSPPRHCKPGGMRWNPSRHAADSDAKGFPLAVIAVA